MIPVEVRANAINDAPTMGDGILQCLVRTVEQTICHGQINQTALPAWGPIDCQRRHEAACIRNLEGRCFYGKSAMLYAFHQHAAPAAFDLGEIL